MVNTPRVNEVIQSDRERLHRLAIERKEIASSDGKIKVTVPGLWTKLPELNKQASLQVGDKSKEMYLIVITDAKADLNNFDLEKHHQLTRDRMLHKMKNASATEAVALTIDGHPAMQDELSGTENNRNVFFILPRTTATIFNRS
jgi:phosphodiesterase/alkaline phosphatase D-like protein